MFFSYHHLFSVLSTATQVCATGLVEMRKMRIRFYVAALLCLACLMYVKPLTWLTGFGQSVLRAG